MDCPYCLVGMCPIHHSVTGTLYECPQCFYKQNVTRGSLVREQGLRERREEAEERRKEFSTQTPPYFKGT